MQRDKVLAYLGLSSRAGHTVSGEFSVEKSLRQRRARLVIVSEEASENTKKKFRDHCAYRQVPLYIYGSGGELGRACGKDFRISVAIEDEGLAKAVIRQFEEQT
ncbi:MAG: ribosomal L7Ae/L30e/S12e/Gadd45 family protein [Lachnospiraceae bacterium]|nr:ribosomal L7Ae/L30e/S12e/Gadd45 family protein [Lachnospiraceae bacterium]MCD8098264.1 ribosomal L7Ae/L30e/S12e/Gadd45 family protein [Lachnospiraceae bacterium]